MLEYFLLEIWMNRLNKGSTKLAIKRTGNAMHTMHQHPFFTLISSRKGSGNLLPALGHPTIKKFSIQNPRVK
jgi:hypothetical protein